MPSNSRNELQRRLRDVDEIIDAHRAITGGGKGKPAQEQGGALTRAGVVLLSAAMEAFVEDLFEEAARLLMPGRTEDEMVSLFKNTSRRLNNADIHKTQMLFFNLGIPWVLENIRWQKFSNNDFKSSVNRLVGARN